MWDYAVIVVTVATVLLLFVSETKEKDISDDCVYTNNELLSDWMQATAVGAAVDRFTRLYEECRLLTSASSSNNNNYNSSLPAARECQVSGVID